ncbi:alpha/beta hydrolase [Roseinatronobacter sp.]
MKLVLVVVALYALVVTCLALFQTAMIFPRALTGPAPPLPDGTARLTLDTADGNTLHGVVIPGLRDDAALLLGFGGNAWNAESMALFLHQHAPDHPVAAFHFRGYAPSTGTPSARALRDDALLIHDHLAPDAAGVIPVGFSIGGGAASYLAARRDVQGLVLVTPFDSLRNVARDSLPWAPVSWLLRHNMDPLSDLRDTRLRIATIAASNDEVIGPARADALVSGLQSSGRAIVQTARIAAGHNDIYSHPDFPPALRAAIAHISQ